MDKTEAHIANETRLPFNLKWSNKIFAEDIIFVDIFSSQISLQSEILKPISG